MKALDAVPIELDELKIVELLQQEVAGVIVQADGGVIVGVIEEHLKRGTVIDVRIGVQLIAKRLAMFMGIVQERLPAFAQLLERFVDDPLRALRPWVHHVPRKGSGQRRDQVGPHMDRSIDAFL